MRLFPASAALLSPPAFPEARLRFKSADLSITAEGFPGRNYVQSIEVDGSPVQNWWARWDTISRAKQFKLKLSAKPVDEPPERRRPCLSGLGSWGRSGPGSVTRRIHIGWRCSEYWAGQIRLERRNICVCGLCAAACAVWLCRMAGNAAKPDTCCGGDCTDYG